MSFKYVRKSYRQALIDAWTNGGREGLLTLAYAWAKNTAERQYSVTLLNRLERTN